MKLPNKLTLAAGLISISAALSACNPFDKISGTWEVDILTTKSIALMKTDGRLGMDRINIVNINGDPTIKITTKSSASAGEWRYVKDADKEYIVSSNGAKIEARFDGSSMIIAVPAWYGYNIYKKK